MPLAPRPQLLDNPLDREMAPWHCPAAVASFSLARLSQRHGSPGHVFLLTDAIAVTGLIAVDFKGDIGIPWFFGSQKDIEGFPYSNFSVRYKIESQVCKSHSSSSIEYEYPNGQAELVPYESLKTIAYTGQ